jgi:hypothetical protein
MIHCSKCGKALDGQDEGGRAASISGSIMGDECTDSYYFCNRCEVYTVEVYHDCFLGEDEVSIRGPLSRQEGEAMLELIRGCAEPWNKKCRCKVHQTYFQGWLD